MNKQYFCHVCGDLLCNENKVKGSKYRCKKCHCDYNKSNYLIKKTAISPQNYFQCEDCDHVFHYLKSKGSMYVKPVEHEKCPKCNSENIDDYIN